MRVCIECGETKPDEDFNQCGFCSDTGKPKRRPRCKPCHYKFVYEQRKRGLIVDHFIELTDPAAVWATRRMA